jgi:hypothetical protein
MVLKMMARFLHSAPLLRGDEVIPMEQEMSASDMVDLYEEMLYTRAAKRIRPVLYVSSHKDLECSVLMLLGEAPETKLAGRRRPAGLGFRQRVMTN